MHNMLETEKITNLLNRSSNTDLSIPGADWILILFTSSSTKNFNKETVFVCKILVWEITIINYYIRYVPIIICDTCINNQYSTDLNIFFKLDNFDHELDTTFR